MRRNQHLKKDTIGLKDNVGKTTFMSSAQAELLKNFDLCILRGDDARPTPAMAIPTAVMPVSQFLMPVRHRELSSLDISKGDGPDDIHRWWYAGLLVFRWALV